jgi:hypothetical protein
MPLPSESDLATRLLRSRNIPDHAISLECTGSAQPVREFQVILPLFQGILVTYLIPSLHQLKGNSRAINRIFMGWAGYWLWKSEH